MSNLKKHCIFLVSLITVSVTWWVVYLLLIFPKYHYDYMKSSTNPKSAIVVLTGGKGRFEKGLDFLKTSKLSEKLFVSGVFSESELRKKYALSEIDKKLFECCISFDNKAINTNQNVIEIKKWVQVNNIKEIFLISSYYHLPRVKILFEKKFPSLEVNLLPVEAELFTVKYLLNFVFHLKVIFTEYLKILYIIFLM